MTSHIIYIYIWNGQIIHSCLKPPTRLPQDWWIYLCIFPKIHCRSFPWYLGPSRGQPWKWGHYVPMCCQYCHLTSLTIPVSWMTWMGLKTKNIEPSNRPFLLSLRFSLQRGSTNIHTIPKEMCRPCRPRLSTWIKSMGDLQDPKMEVR